MRRRAIFRPPGSEGDRSAPLASLHPIPCRALMFDQLAPRGALRLASDRGKAFVDDPLTVGSARAAQVVQGGATRDVEALTVVATETLLHAALAAVPGNRSLYARVRFRCADPAALVELRAVQTTQPVRGQRLSPLRARLDGRVFTVLGLHGEVLAGDPDAVVPRSASGGWRTLELLTFEKAVYARVSGYDRVLVLPDNLRFIPGTPGLRVVAPSASAVQLRDWLVTAVGPHDAALGAIGDSITAGLQHGPEADSYVHRVTRALGQPLTLNAGSGGATTALDRARFAYEIAPFRPRLVWIEGGTNDLTGGRPADEIFSHHRAMIAAMDWPGRALLSTVPPRNTDAAAVNRERETLNTLIRLSGVPFVDRARIVGESGGGGRLRAAFDAGDGTHLNPAGNAAIADEALRVIRAL